ncbi:MAG: GspE/PulE family protein [Acetobacteraceae bacterium]
MITAGADPLTLSEAVLARLTAAGRIDAAALARGRQAGGPSLLWTLVDLGILAERELAEAFAAALGHELPGPEAFPAAPLFADRLDPAYLRRNRLVPLDSTQAGVRLAMADPCDHRALSFMAIALDQPVIPLAALAADVEAALDRLYPRADAAAATAPTTAAETAEQDAERLRDMASEAPVVQIVNALIARAVAARASDIHLEPTENGLGIRLRVDGRMRAEPSPPPDLRAAIVSRIKIMARLNIAERRLPQDGRFRAVVRGRAYDLRVATVPTLHGEAVTMRLLDQEAMALDFSALGFAPDTLERYHRIIAAPQGIVLVTGPTGSGKTTTLYATLRQLNRPDVKLFTVEDPIEYQLPGVNQIQVAPQIELSFAAVLRTLLRHNPDVIMIGEMRDLETARIAVQAALTGHLVLSTLHTNGAAAAITRLLDMQVEDYLITSTLAGVTAQRLVRRLCPFCRAPAHLPEALARRTGLWAEGQPDPPELWRPVGCAACGDTGFHGQIALVELLVMTDPLRQLVLHHAEAATLHETAVAEGMRSMYEDGLRCVRAGVTTLDEVLRVTRAG